jgi:DNA-directed RNA polymerase specialized sigma24 family protein
MEKRYFGDRFRVTFDPEILDGYTNDYSPWHESKAEIEAGLAWGKEKARLLKWVRSQMRRHLTITQQQCIELHYFKDLSYTEVSKRTGISRTSVCRAVQRGVHRLRALVRTDPPEHLRLKRRR